MRAWRDGLSAPRGIGRGRGGGEEPLLENGGDEGHARVLCFFHQSMGVAGDRTVESAFGFGKFNGKREDFPLEEPPARGEADSALQAADHVLRGARGCDAPRRSHKGGIEKTEQRCKSSGRTVVRRCGEQKECFRPPCEYPGETGSPGRGMAPNGEMMTFVEHDGVPADGR